MVAGIGMGFRHPIADALFESAPRGLAWVEIHPENYVRRGGKFEKLLADACARWPVVTHGLSMCFGAVEPFDAGFLRDVRGLLDDVGAPWHSDHLCFAGVDGTFVHDLIPLPRNAESIAVVVDRIRQAQDSLGRPIAVEPVSYYVEPPGSEMDELDFLNEILERADAQLLLDVNNVFVNSQNHGFDPYTWLDRVPYDRVVQLHVAGHLIRPDGLRIDTHAEPICEETYALLEHALRRIDRPIGVLLERDDNFDSFEALAGEVTRLSEIYARTIDRPSRASAQVQP